MTRPMTSQALVEVLSDLMRDRTPVLVAIDGRSGAGKSTLARQLADAFKTAVIPADDFFAAHVTDAGWDARTTAERASDCLDWRRLRREALEPLKAGRPAAWRALDFARGPRADGSHGLQETATARASAPVVLVDGAYSSRPELADLIDLTVLVEAPDELRAMRLAAREEPAFLAAWRARWGSAEEHYFTVVRPPATFDIVLVGE